MFVETHSRAVAKAVSYRVFGTLATAGLVYVFTGKPLVALSVGLLEALSKIALYFGHERLWENVRYGRRQIEPVVLWFTGLSGSGKSTISKRVYDELKRRGWRVEYLDGDSIRHIFPHAGFSKEERDNHIRRVGHLAGTLEKNGIFVVASFISPYRETREFARRQCRRFLEVYVSTPLEVCEKRDVKGLYAKARRGELKNFTGIDDPYEPPAAAELDLDTARLSEDEAVARVLERLDGATA